MNDYEYKRWIEINDIKLYDWARQWMRQNKGGMLGFIQANRAEIDAAINSFNEKDANTRRLIAAAPDLLEACRYKHNDSMDGDLLCVVANWLLNYISFLKENAEMIDRISPNRHVQSSRLEQLANELLHKHSLQKAALAKARGKDGE